MVAICLFVRTNDISAHWIRTVFPNKVMNLHVVTVQFGSRVIPTHNTLTSCRVCIN